MIQLACGVFKCPENPKSQIHCGEAIFGYTISPRHKKGLIRFSKSPQILWEKLKGIQGDLPILHQILVDCE
ncbi:hypothetical protein HNY73_010376 [Argiope bruennichi]|uniref:Uncharacterized protein n=1 Tax=Argiope bruennichi TaxID=94029 RepID=A0A8T0F2P6_ARGBR|nr:hypothetical protein HNY73_010376 [Argiope bruennichi]